MALSVSPRATTWTLLKSAVWRLAALASCSGSAYSMNVQFSRARTGTPSGMNMRKRSLTRESTQRRFSEAIFTRRTGGAWSSPSIAISPTTGPVCSRTSCLGSVGVS